MILHSSTDETTLVGRARRGDREAFDEIDRRYRGKLCRFLARHASGTAQAEELAQQTLVKAFLSLDTLRHHDRIGGWLYRIAFRLAVDESRKNEPELIDFEKSTRIVDHRAAIDADPADEVENLWTTARNVLKPNEYTVVWLKYVDGYKVDSIAKIMGKTRISVRVLLFRARKKLLPVLAARQEND